MKTRRAHEGYLMLDHRAGGGALIESATYTCKHCQRVVVLNPERTRARGYCRGCDHHICDECEAERAASGGVCRDFNRLAEQIQESAARSLNLPQL